MTVSELIDVLSKLPAEARVLIPSDARELGIALSDPEEIAYIACENFVTIE